MLSLVSRAVLPHCRHIPRPTSVTIAIRASDGSGMDRDNHIFLENGGEIFWTRGLEQPIGLKPLTKLIHART